MKGNKYRDRAVRDWIWTTAGNCATMMPRGIGDRINLLFAVLAFDITHSLSHESNICRKRVSKTAEQVVNHVHLRADRIRLGTEVTR
jgi:hypothetical protein